MLQTAGIITYPALHDALMCTEECYVLVLAVLRDQESQWGARTMIPTMMLKAYENRPKFNTMAAMLNS